MILSVPDQSKIGKKTVILIIFNIFILCYLNFSNFTLLYVSFNFNCNLFKKLY